MVPTIELRKSGSESTSRNARRIPWRACVARNTRFECDSAWNGSSVMPNGGRVGHIVSKGGIGRVWRTPPGGEPALAEPSPRQRVEPREVAGMQRHGFEEQWERKRHADGDDDR